jgi:phosphatidylserine/phosphatidylglycerophosphate/cardiolipin synthase-like enzyme
METKRLPSSSRSWLAPFYLVASKKVFQKKKAFSLFVVNAYGTTENNRPSGSLVDPITAHYSLVQVLESNVRAEKFHIQRSLPVIIRSSERRCYITSPYFLPPARIRNALIEAAKRGVDVRIVTAGRTDVKLAKLAGRHL